MTTSRQKILDTVSDLGSNFWFYDRKEDEDLSTDDIEEALESGEITLDEIVEAFREAIS